MLTADEQTVVPADTTATSAMNASRSTQKVYERLNLRAGEWVEVRSAKEIAATLDESQSLEGLPFMPEMLPYCGRRFRVYKSAHKTCDTIERYAIRLMANAVHLEGLRCDGEAHGGCQAACLLFWKDAWLKRAEGGSASETGNQTDSGTGRSRARPASAWPALARATRAAQPEGETEARYRCQTTDLVKATTDVRRRDRWKPSLYLKDLTSGNVKLHEFIRYGLLAIFNHLTGTLFGRRYPHVCGRAGDKTPNAQLNLRPGELVQVRSKDDIMRTLNSQQKNRGLWFDVEMLPYCEKEIPVLHRVEKIVDERTGRMIKLPNSCVILDGAACGGKLSPNRMFCPRSIYPFWREVWLERVEQKTHDGNIGS